MLNKFCKKPLYEVTQTLAKVAMGVEPAELVIRNASLVNVCTAEIQEGIDVAISEGRIALVGDASHCIGDGTKIIDAGGQYIAPGFMDAHIHVESAMISVGEYARAVVPHGTTGIGPARDLQCVRSGRRPCHDRGRQARASEGNVQRSFMRSCCSWF